MSISLSQIAKVTPSVLSAGGSQNSFPGLLLVRDDASIPVGSAIAFSSAADVQDYTGDTSGSGYLSKCAAAYFGGVTSALTTPSVFYIGSCLNKTVPGNWVSGGRQDPAFSYASLTGTGTFAFSMDGTVYSLDAFNFSGQSSGTALASALDSAFAALVPAPAVTVSYNVSARNLQITAADNTAPHALSFNVPNLGLQQGVLLCSVSAQTVSEMSINANLVSAASSGFASIVGKTSFYGVAVSDTIPDGDTLTFQAVTESISSQFPNFLYAVPDEPSESIGGTISGGWVSSTNGICPVHVPAAQAGLGDVATCAVLGWAASTDFQATNGRSSLSNRTFNYNLSDYTVNDNITALTYETEGMNYIGDFTGNSRTRIILRNGTVSGKFAFADSYVGQIILNQNLQGALVDLLNNVGSIPYNAKGRSMINSALLNPIQAAVNFGTIRTGVTLSVSQISQIANAVGVDVSGTLSAQGYYIDVKDASPATRAARTSPPITVYYTDGGSVQSLALASIEVQ